MCNEMQKEGHLIDFTLPDAMQNLRAIADAHSKRQGMALIPGEKVRSGFIKEVMGIYCGGSGFSNNTMRNICGIVVRLSASVVQGIKELLTEECEDYWTTLGPRRPFGSDTRVYKKLLSSQSLKGVKSFLTHSAMTDEDRINVIHRIRFLARERESFKAFTPAEIERQCRCVINARAEITKFEDFLGEDPWPQCMESLKRNMLQTTLFDGDVMEHTGAGKELLVPFVDAYLKATGTHGTQKLSLFRRRLEAETSVQDDENSSGSEQQDRARGENRNCDLDCTRNEPQSQGIDINSEEVAEEPRIEQEDPNLCLEECGVRVHDQTLLEFERNSFDLGRSVDMGGTFDFIVADPFQKVPFDESQETNSNSLVDDKGVSLYIQCLRRLLVRGGYGFIFLGWDQLQLWYSFCVKSKLDIVSDPFLVTKDANRVQGMTTKGLQSMYEPAFVVRKPGKHPLGFEIDKISSYAQLPDCRMPRWCNVIDGVPPPSQRLTFKPSRALVRPNERPCALYIELFKTFCPENGKVLDPRAGTLTTGLACIATNRKCVLLESDDRCLSFALPRLWDFAKAKLAENTAAHVLAQGLFVEDQETMRERISEDNHPSASDCSLEDNEALPKNNIPDVIVKLPIRSASRGSGSFSDVTPGGSPAREEELHTEGHRNNAGQECYDSEYRTPVALKRSRSHPLPEKTILPDVGSPASCRRSKRGRHPVARYTE